MTDPTITELLTQTADAIEDQRLNDAYNLVTEAQALINTERTDGRRPWNIVVVYPIGERRVKHTVQVKAASRALAYTAATSWARANLNIPASTPIFTHTND